MGATGNIATWNTSDGTTHEFTVYAFNSNWNAVGGVYIFSYFDGQYWRPLYIGETDNFSRRLPTHERWTDAQRAGATHIHAITVQQAAMRAALEQRLIQDYQPPLNTQLR